MEKENKPLEFRVGAKGGVSVYRLRLGKVSGDALLPTMDALARSVSRIDRVPVPSSSG